jgi:hypothetical protein
MCVANLAVLRVYRWCKAKTVAVRVVIVGWTINKPDERATTPDPPRWTTERNK